MGLIVQTDTGQEWLRKQDDVLQAIGQHYGALVMQTPIYSDAPVDAILSRRGEMVAVIEVKCRQFSRKQLEQWGSGLVTASKLTDGILIASALRIPFFVFFGLNDGTIVYWHICDKHGIKQFAWEEKHTATKQTVEGGTVHRRNAFLPVTHMKVMPDAHQ